MTPGQLVYDTGHRGYATDEDWSPPPWDKLTDEERADWEAAAQAGADASAMTGILTAVKAASGDTIAIAFNHPVSARMAHDVAARWKAYAPDVTLVLVDDVAAIETSAADGEPDVHR